MDSLVVSDFREKLRSRSDNTVHLDFQLGDLNFTAGKKPSVKVGDDHYYLTDGSFRQIAEELSVPVPYARRIPDDLLSYTVNYFIKDNKNYHLAALVEGDHLRSFMRANTPYVSNVEMFDAVVDAVGSEYDLKYVSDSDTRTSFSILPNNYRESIDGTNLFGGVKVIYSDAWDVHPTIDSYIWREICANGLINEIEKKKFRVTGSTHDGVLRQIRDFSSLAIEKIPELFENFAMLVDEKVDDFNKVIRRIVLEYKLPNKVLNRLLFWASHPDFLETITNHKIVNMNDVVNLLTYTGSHDYELTDDLRQRLMQIAGNLTLTHHERCTSCGSSF